MIKQPKLGGQQRSYFAFRSELILQQCTLLKWYVFSSFLEAPRLLCQRHSRFHRIAMSIAGFSDSLWELLLARRLEWTWSSDSQLVVAAVSAAPPPCFAAAPPVPGQGGETGDSQSPAIADTSENSVPPPCFAAPPPCFAAPPPEAAPPTTEAEVAPPVSVQGTNVCFVGCPGVGEEWFLKKQRLDKLWMVDLRQPVPYPGRHPEAESLGMWLEDFDTELKDGLLRHGIWPWVESAQEMMSKSLRSPAPQPPPALPAPRQRSRSRSPPRPEMRSPSPPRKWLTEKDLEAMIE